MFRAHDPANGRFVALKIFRLDLTAEQSRALAGALEHLVAEQPRHPAIAAAVASGADGSVAYLAQEYVAGEALDAALRQHGVPPLDEALVTLGWLAEALDRAAGEGIHHGALHPRDVLISAGGEAHLIDLGVAEALQRSGLRAPVRRPYGAPERREGRSWGGAADIFALGAIAYELVTGRRVAGPGSPTLAVEGMTGLDQSALAEVLGRALAVDPAARFASASDLVDMLRPILARARRVSLARRRPKSGAIEGAVPLPLEGEPTIALGGGDAADLPLTVVDEHRRFEDLVSDAPFPQEGPGPVRPEPYRGSVSNPESSVLQGATWQAAPDAGPPRGRVTPLLIALFLGLAGGFGLGYWTAWRAAMNEQARAAATVTPQASAIAESGGPTRVEEPAVRGEGAPPPATAPALTAPSATVPAPQARTAPPPVTERTRARRETVAPGKLLVKSTPSGARVTVNGRVRGKTPLILRDLPLRVMTVQVEQPGFKPNEQRVALSAARPTATVDARLVAEAPEVIAGTTTGSLVVESRPSGARVFVDNQEVGTSPLSMPEVAPGNHRVRLELGGFNPWVTMAEVKLGARTRVSASLEQGQQR